MGSIRDLRVWYVLSLGFHLGALMNRTKSVLGAC